MTGFGTFSGIALECRDPRALAAFYAAITGWEIVFDNDDWVSIGPGRDAAWHLSFQHAPGHVPPVWPDDTSSMQFHLHFRVADRAAAEERVRELGGVHLGGDVWADPAGHPFCLVDARPS